MGHLTEHGREALQQALDQYRDERPVGSLSADHVGGIITVGDVEGVLLKVTHDHWRRTTIRVEPEEPGEPYDTTFNNQAILCVLSAKGVVVR